MKKNCNKFFLLAVFMLLVSITAFSQSHTIASSDEILSFTDPGVTTWIEPEIDGSLILSWDEGTIGIAGGFCDLTAYTPFPNGGKYEISLISVIDGTADEINGIWQVKKNGTVVTVTMGTATNLSTTFGGTITITIDGFVIVIRVSFKIDGVFDPQTISGQAFVDGVPLAGATARLRGSGAELDEQSTDINGKYLFNIDPADVKRVLVIFKNFDPDIVLSGYIFVAGQPLAGATVTVQNQVGDLDTFVTNADGYYQSSHILNAVGAGENNIKLIILNK